MLVNWLLKLPPGKLDILGLELVWSGKQELPFQVTCGSQRRLMGYGGRRDQEWPWLCVTPD